MANELHVTDLIPAYVLGALDGDEARLVAEHLKVCATCREELSEYEIVATQMAYAVPQVAPLPLLQEKLMARVRTSSEAAPIPPSAALPQKNWWDALVDLFRQPLPRNLAIAAIVLAIAVGVWQTALPKKQSAPAHTMQTIALVSTEAAPDAKGVMIIGTDGRDGAVVVEHLPRLDENHQYQLWLIENGERTSGAVFSVDDDGYGVIAVRPDRPLTDFSAFGITIEPAGGSPAPTGEKVLGGTL